MIRNIIGKCWAVFAVLTILSAVLFTLARVLAPLAENYQKEIIFSVSSSLGQPVEVAELEVEWHGLGPRFSLRDISILDESGERSLLEFNEARIGVDVLSSLVNQRLDLGSLTVVGAKLSIIRHADGRMAVLGFSPGQADAQDQEGNGSLLEWLLSQNHMALEASEITVHDIKRGGDILHFENINLSLRNDRQRHQLSGSAILPETMGRKLSFAIDLEGDLIKPDGWSGRVYVDGEGVRLGKLLEGTAFSEIPVDKGEADFSLWSEWKKAKLITLEGVLSASDLALLPIKIANDGNARADAAAETDKKSVPDQLPLKIEKVAGRFVLQRQSDAWLFAVNDLVIDRNGKVWPNSKLTVALSASKESPHFAARASFLRLQDMDALWVASNIFPGDLRETLVALAPGGDFKNLNVRYKREEDGVKQLSLESSFEDLTLSPWKKFPGINGVDGEVHANENEGELMLATNTASVDIEHLFRDPIPVDALSGNIAWQHHDGAWQVSAEELVLHNEDLHVKGGVYLELPGNGESPYLDLTLDFNGEPHSGAHASLYFPAHIMRKSTLDWLDQAIVSATITHGQAIFKGHTKQFPFDNDEGKFEVRFALVDGILEYARQWPRIEEIEAEAVFSNRHMSIEAVSGKSLASEIIKTTVTIENMAARPALLVVQGKVRGPTSDALRYLRESPPLEKKFSAFLEGTDASGQSQLNLALNIALNKTPARIKGEISFEDSSLLLANGNIDITGLNGVLNFTEEGLMATDIRGRLLGMDSRFDVETVHDKETSTTFVRAEGSATAADITRLVDIPLLKSLEGEADWHSIMRIPGTGKAQDEHTSVRIASNLKGVSVDLPEPLSKKAEVIRKLVIETELPRTLDSPLHIVYGKVLAGLFDVDKHLKMQRGELRFGEGVLSLPDRNGLSITGHLADFSYQEWAPFLQAGKEKRESTPHMDIQSVDMKIGSAEVAGRFFHNITLAAEKNAQVWDADIKSDELIGNIKIPRDGKLPFDANLEYLRLVSSPKSAGEKTIDPRDVPPIKLKSQKFIYGDIDFGSLDLVATRHEMGVHLERLFLESPKMNIDGRGDWLIVNDEHYSSFTIKSSSQDLGKALAGLGYADTIDDGKSIINISARWPGPPTAFALDRLNGNMQLEIKDGRMLDVEPGAGRIFGLISLQALPRRLTLDFSDIFEKGFSFDSIKGDFSIKDGEATTENLVMEGSAARLEASGRIGLAARDYDQLVKVIPNVGGGLPVAGAVAGGVGVGAVILLAEKLFRPGIEKITQVDYSVTGPWDDPVIKQLSVNE